MKKRKLVFNINRFQMVQNRFSTRSKISLLGNKEERRNRTALVQGTALTDLIAEEKEGGRSSTTGKRGTHVTPL